MQQYLLGARRNKWLVKAGQAFVCVWGGEPTIHLVKISVARRFDARAPPPIPKPPGSCGHTACSGWPALAAEAGPLSPRCAHSTAGIAPNRFQARALKGTPSPGTEPPLRAQPLNTSACNPRAPRRPPLDQIGACTRAASAHESRGAPVTPAPGTPPPRRPRSNGRRSACTCAPWRRRRPVTAAPRAPGARRAGRRARPSNEFTPPPGWRAGRALSGAAGRVRRLAAPRAPDTRAKTTTELQGGREGPGRARPPAQLAQGARAPWRTARPVGPCCPQLEFPPCTARALPRPRRGRAAPPPRAAIREASAARGAGRRAAGRGPWGSAPPSGRSRGASPGRGNRGAGAHSLPSSRARSAAAASLTSRSASVSCTAENTAENT